MGSFAFSLIFDLETLFICSLCSFSFISFIIWLILILSLCIVLVTVVASLASLSVCSLPCIPMWAGTFIRYMLLFKPALLSSFIVCNINAEFVCCLFKSLKLLVMLESRIGYISFRIYSNWCWSILQLLEWQTFRIETLKW